MTQTVVDQRGRVLIPEGIREDTGFDHGTVVEVEEEGGRVSRIGRVHARSRASGNRF